MRKLPLLPLTFGLILAFISVAFGQGVNYNPNPSSPALDSGMAMPGRNTSAAGPNNTANGAKDDENDPSLQRLRSEDSLGQGSMSRDDGQLTAKVRRREKISKVESTKQLPTSGIDPKFQGSLLHSSVTSIGDIGGNANTNANASSTADSNADASADTADDDSSARFKSKRLVFTPMTNDDSKTKQESSSTKAESSPSPSPSPTASATPSSH